MHVFLVQFLFIPDLPGDFRERFIETAIRNHEEEVVAKLFNGLHEHVCSQPIWDRDGPYLAEEYANIRIEITEKAKALEKVIQGWDGMFSVLPDPVVETIPSAGDAADVAMTDKDVHSTGQFSKIMFDMVEYAEGKKDDEEEPVNPLTREEYIELLSDEEEDEPEPGPLKSASNGSNEIKSPRRESVGVGVRKSPRRTSKISSDDKTGDSEHEHQAKKRRVYVYKSSSEGGSVTI